ncbi:MAG TPA: thiamine pyrophosphate-binding protein [Candidatus Angelobacter sp.]|nr:thiamine pyrophosphate-binding protein [Candidatus Angelobacter sp.]
MPSTAAQATGAGRIIEALLSCGITAGFGIPSIHNIALYEALRQEPGFRHWIVRHEQAAGFAADAFFRASGRPAAVFASTGPGNLFTLVPLLESLQSNTPVLLIGTNVATPVLGKPCNALHETPDQLGVLRPLTRFAARANTAEEIPAILAEAAVVLTGPAPGPVFIEIPHDLLLAPVSAELFSLKKRTTGNPPEASLQEAVRQIEMRQRPVILAGAGITAEEAFSVQRLAEMLHAPILTTTGSKGIIADDHPLSMGCISRLGMARQLLQEADLLISFSARLTEFDTGRFTLKIPPAHLAIVEDQVCLSGVFPAEAKVIGDAGAIAAELMKRLKPRRIWWDVAAARAEEGKQIESLQADGYAAVMLLRETLARTDVVVNDQSILNYWASAFFPVLEPGTFLYPWGSGTLGYGLPAAIGAACALREKGDPRKIVCIAGDGGFQYTAHELATLAQYDLPVKVLLVNDNKYGIIGFLQRSLFGQEHEVNLKNPDFCRLAEAHGVPAERVHDLKGLKEKLQSWLEVPGPGMLEWQTKLLAPWEAGAIQRPAGKPDEPSRES